MGSRSGLRKMSNLPIRPAKSLKLASPALEQKELSIPGLFVSISKCASNYMIF